MTSPIIFHILVHYYAKYLFPSIFISADPRGAIAYAGTEKALANRVRGIITVGWADNLGWLEKLRKKCIHICVSSA